MLVFFDDKYVQKLYIDACFLIFTIIDNRPILRCLGSKNNIRETLVYSVIHTKAKFRGKMRESTGKWGQNEEMFLSCPTGSEGLAMALEMMFTLAYNDNYCKF